tara:strand:- start:9033 stop:9587 length:555 start_codon:yes stop_codon:yes gene_type:complete
MQNKVVFILVVIAFLIACSNNSFTPVPKAYHKIHLPKKQYEKVSFNNFFLFQKPAYSQLNYLDKQSFDIEFKDLNATLHFSYYNLQNDLLEHIKYCNYLAYKHDFMAESISENTFINKKENVFGLLYDYDGATATSTQFYLTDSINHFVRGALYFNFEVTDSISPINSFLKEDVRYMIESLVWQ